MDIKRTDLISKLKLKAKALRKENKSLNLKIAKFGLGKEDVYGPEEETPVTPGNPDTTETPETQSPETPEVIDEPGVVEEGISVEN